MGIDLGVRRALVTDTLLGHDHCIFVGHLCEVNENVFFPLNAWRMLRLVVAAVVRSRRLQLVHGVASLSDLMRR
jgi:hypothetical protein